MSHSHVLRAGFAALGLLALASSAASAHDYKLGDLSIGHPWSRATPAGARVAAGYLSITNSGAAPDRLVAVESPAAARVEIHESSEKDGVATMRPVEAIAVAPGETVKLAPGGYHLMFMQPKVPFKQGDRVEGTLRFEKAGTVAVVFHVEGIGAQGGGDSGHGGHNH